MTMTPIAPANQSRVAEFQPLSAQDRLFLLCETGSAHMHVGAALVFDRGPLSQTGGSINFERIRRHVAARLKDIPRYRQRLSFAPLKSRPHWVDDNAFDLNHHVRHLRVPHPGTDAQLKQLCGQLFSQRLDRDRPLWELFVIEGLEHGRFALVAKTHHCMVDGIGGTQLMAALLDPIATRDDDEPQTWLPRPQPSTKEVLQLELSRLAQSFSWGKQLRGMVQTPGDSAARLSEQVFGLSQFLGNGLWPAPDCILNRSISAQRRFEWLTVNLDDVKRVKAKFGATVNDVVMATIAGALRRFLQGRPGTPRPTQLRTLVPVNVRQGTDEQLGNHVAALLVPLPLGISDPRRRLMSVAARMRSAKTSRQAEAAKMLSGAAVPLLATLMRFADRLKSFNLVVTNVPGPPIPLYLAGAPLREIFPQVPLFLNQGLGIALFSYAGKLHWGLNADHDLLPDVAALKEALLDSFNELLALTQRPKRAKSNVVPWPGRVKAAS
jgi:WS/DGAT/MGAT family acyltransferase